MNSLNPATVHQMQDSVKTTFYASYARCQGQPGFFDFFYDTFIDSSDEVRDKFSKTDMSKQIRTLTNSFYSNKLAVSESKMIQENLLQLAQLHSRQGRDIRPDLFDLWLDCLLDAVREFDAEYSVEIEAAWRSMMAPGISLMKENY